MTRDTSASDYLELAREIDHAHEGVGGDPAQLAAHLQSADPALLRATTPGNRAARGSRDDVLASLHAARRRAALPQALPSVP